MDRDEKGPTHSRAGVASRFVKIEVRDVRPTEWQELKALRLRALVDAPLAFDSTIEREEARPDDFWRRLASGRTHATVTLFALIDGRPVGLAGGVVFEDEEHPQLVMMWVDPAFRDCDLGVKLVDGVVDWATSRNFGQLRLWVAETNEPARRLYERCGFVPTGKSGPLPAHPHIIELEMSRSLR
jgi:GNAT superfamily N-acetyltransferase